MTEERKQQHDKLVERIEKQQMDILKAAQAAKAMQRIQEDEAQMKAEEEKQRQNMLLRQKQQDELQIKP